MKLNRVWVTVAAMLSIWICGAATAQAATVSYYLNQSNVDSSLPDGTNYALVTINDNVANTLSFTVSLFTPLTSIAGSNFGIDTFDFNVVGANPLADLGTVAGQWTLSSGWSANVAPPPNQADGFGKFDAEVSTTGQNRVAALTFTVNNTGLTAYDFAKASTNGNGQGNVYFAAHVAGFTASGGVTSGYFGGSTIAAVPLPAALPLLLSGLSGFGVFARRRRAC